jgi:hypothetical protein
VVADEVVEWKQRRVDGKSVGMGQWPAKIVLCWKSSHACVVLLTLA